MAVRRRRPVLLLVTRRLGRQPSEPWSEPLQRFRTTNPRRQTVQRNRWKQLAKDGEKRGKVQYVSLEQFVELFLRIKQDPKQQASKIGKRLRDDGCPTADSSVHQGVGRPPKLARMSDLKTLYPQHV